MSVRKWLWIALGMLSFSAGTVGIFLPILPTVPLYLLTSFAFLNSSDKLYLRFKNSNLYKKYLSRYLEAGGLTKCGKFRLILFVTVQIIIAVFLLRKSLMGVLILAGIYFGFLFSVIFVIKTVKLKK